MTTRAAGMRPGLGAEGQGHGTCTVSRPPVFCLETAQTLMLMATTTAENVADDISLDGTCARDPRSSNPGFCSQKVVGGYVRALREPSQGERGSVRNLW